MHYKKGIWISFAFVISVALIAVNVKAQGEVFTGLTGCYVANGSCNAGDTRLFNISDRQNAHVGERFGYAVCCSDANVALTNSCSASIKKVMFNVSNLIDGHVALRNDNLSYSNPVCMGTTDDGNPVDCNYAYNNSNCAADYLCVVKISDYSSGGRHVGDCSNTSIYQTSLCCAAGPGFTTTSTSTILYNVTIIPASSQPGVCGDGVVNFGEQCDSTTPTDVGCQIIGFNSCDVQGLKTGLPCTCFSSFGAGGIETIVFQSDCQDDGNGDEQGLRQVTTKEVNPDGTLRSEVNEQRTCTIPPLSVPFFGWGNALIVIGILSLYYIIKKKS